MKSKISKSKSKEQTSENEVVAKRKNKQQIIIDMLKSKDGACLDEIVEATGWQKHSVRGVMAGSLKKKLGLNINSEVRGNARVYFIAPQVQSAEAE